MSPNPSETDCLLLTGRCLWLLACNFSFLLIFIGGAIAGYYLAARKQ